MMIEVVSPINLNPLDKRPYDSSIIYVEGLVKCPLFIIRNNILFIMDSNTDTPYATQIGSTYYARYDALQTGYDRIIKALLDFLDSRTSTTSRVTYRISNEIKDTRLIYLYRYDFIENKRYIEYYKNPSFISVSRPCRLHVSYEEMDIKLKGTLTEIAL